MSQSLSQVWTHIIFSTKKRYPFFKEITMQQQVHAYIKKICQEKNCEVVAIGGVEDHVHVLINLHKNTCLSKLIEEIKRSSSLWIKKLDGFKTILSEFYWQRGYAAFSVSQSKLETTKLYIKNQFAHHQKINFQDELRRFLIKQGIEYKEEYLWD